MLKGIRWSEKQWDSQEGRSGRPFEQTKKVQKLILAVNICIPEERMLWPKDFKKSEDHLDLEMNASSYLSLVPFYI